MLLGSTLFAQQVNVSQRTRILDTTSNKTNIPVSDFHIHITTKHYYRDIDNPNVILSLRENPAEIRRRFGNINWAEVGLNSRARKIGKESNYRNYNQADYAELRNVQGSILFNSFYPFEKILTIKKFHQLANRHFISKIDMSRLRVIASDENYPFKEFEAEYRLAANLNGDNADTRIRFVRNAEELRKCLDSNITVLIMAIEGGQVFQGAITGNSANIRKYPCNEDCEKEILSKLHKIKNLEHRLFFLGTSHFAWNKISGHAKTLDKRGLRRFIVSLMATSENQRKSMFLKWGEGIHGEIDRGDYDTIHSPDGRLCCSLPYTKTPDHLTIGRKVISALLDPNNTIHEKPTYIDIKHMDIQAREEYYHLKDSLEKVYDIQIPIIASHVAVSGESLPIAWATGLNPLYDRYSELRNPLKFYKKQQRDKQDLCWKTVTHHLRGRAFNPFANINEETAGWFYPWSFNMYDEEISRIHCSKGIMGIMLDNRQLGSNMKKYTKAYKKNTREKFLRAIAGSNGHKSFDEYWELEPLMRNMMYIAEHCGPKSCWDHVALGSDFDGLIEPLKVATSARQYPDLKQKLTDYFKAFITIHDKRSSLDGLTVEQIMDKFFFENGKRLVLEYF